MLKTRKKQMLKNRLLKDFSVVLAAGAGAAAAVVVASSTVPAAAAALGFTSRVATTSKAGQQSHFGRPVLLKGFPTGAAGAIFEFKFNDQDEIEKIEGFWTENPSVRGQEPEGVLNDPFVSWNANVDGLWKKPTYELVEFSEVDPTELRRIKSLHLPSKQRVQDDFRLNFNWRHRDPEKLQGFFQLRDEDGDVVRYEGFATSYFGEPAACTSRCGDTVSVAEPSLTLGFITLASLMLGSRKKKEAKKT